jgi:hypothetical protein
VAVPKSKHDTIDPLLSKSTYQVLVVEAASALMTPGEGRGYVDAERKARKYFVRLVKGWRGCSGVWLEALIVRWAEEREAEIPNYRLLNQA